MGLNSELFRGDAALQSCLINDSAHITVGSRGAHVGKIQKALVYLDSARIGDQEILGGVYGSSTAAAVLAYKQKRNIINRSYQNAADNIVGKMTIASLDQEFSKLETPPRPGVCRDETKVTPTQTLSTRAGLTGFEILPGRLNLAIHEALLPGETVNTNSLRNALLIGRATTLLAPFNLRINATFLSSFSFPFSIRETDDIDARKVREAAAKANAGSDPILRVIHCSFKPTTSTGISHGERTQVKGFKNFILLDKNKLHPDLGTLLHEMIHCSDDNLMNDIHDPDPLSVYSTGQQFRTLLKLEHAISLSKSFFHTRG
ncbi:MAG: peptidoglycan-binding domain-containing protein [Pyrinomonadaceae bacterium]